jgi:ATP-dependent DNA ligase
MKQDSTNNFSFIEPMKALPVSDLPAGDWLYEMKFDGYRALAFKAGEEVRLVSRNQIDFGNNYPQLIDSLKLLTAKELIIDREIVRLTRTEKHRSTSYNRTASTKTSRWSTTLSICSGQRKLIYALDRSSNGVSS